MDASGEDSATRRLAVLQRHLGGEKTAMAPCAAKVRSSAPMSSSKTEIQKAFPSKRQEVLRWNGWGYKDSGFIVNEKNVAHFTGKRYEVGGKDLPFALPWFKAKYGLDISQTSFSQPHPDAKDLSQAKPCPEFVEAVRPHSVAISDEPGDRLFHSHGHTCHELFALRTGKFGRIVDLVVWPGSHANVEAIISAAIKFNICLIPFGGGTNVSGALECPEDETRPIVSLDMMEMDKILWIDQENLTAHVEAGIIGQDLERKLEEKGYTSGHEPDSQEFSSLGGWVATRSSGMKKNTYGNIEDIVVRIRMATPRGTMARNFLGPRNSIGPDIQHFMMGSEGTLGVITEVTIRIRPIPETRRYGSVVFTLFELGVDFMREVARQQCAPASIRLMDNIQFQMGQVMKPAPTFLQSLVDSMKKIYITKFKGFNPDEMVACTLLFEGTPEEVSVQEKRIYNIASKYGGVPGGEENGRRGYVFTFAIAYMRDLALDFRYLAESFETAVPWSRVKELCHNVKARVERECQRYGISLPPLISCRVTQTYDAGACVYFYLAISYEGVSDPIGVFTEVEAAARDEILASGGSLSHHHGVGKLRRKWLPSVLSDPGVEMIRAVKQSVDPNNIFACGNLLPPLHDQYPRPQVDAP